MSEVRVSRRPAIPWSLVLVLIVVPLGALSLDPTSAQEASTTQESSLCTEVAHVSWQTDSSTASVAGAVVDVPGCDDGETVGIQLLTDDGDVPADGPLIAGTVAEAATFDLSSLDQLIEPVIGVRVFLELSDEEVTLVDVTVERRFFNRGGNEQVGLRETLDLRVPSGTEYDVEGAPEGYFEAPCPEALTEDDSVIREGSGPATATKSGRHLVCFERE